MVTNDGSKEENKRHTHQIQKKGDSMAKKKTVMTDATVDAFEQMVGSATVAPGKKKDNKPAIILNKADLDCLIRFLKAKKAFKEAEGEVKALAGRLLSSNSNIK